MSMQFGSAESRRRRERAKKRTKSQKENTSTRGRNKKNGVTLSQQVRLGESTARDVEPHLGDESKKKQSKAKQSKERK